MPTPEEQIIVLKVALAIIIACAGLLWALPTECRCGFCSTHVTQRALKVEAGRVKRHREMHAAFRIPWGSAQCPNCKAGYGSDEP